MNVVFVIGGARSGKSSFALDQANKCAGKKVYIATAQAFDDEMRERIDKHRDERGSDWDTIEEPLSLPDAVRSASTTHDIVIIDCLTLWLSNLLCNSLDADAEIQALLDSLQITYHSSRLYLVSNEVGMGIVPENELARRFRDLAGKLNQKIAASADEVYLVAAGIPIKIK